MKNKKIKYKWNKKKCFRNILKLLTIFGMAALFVLMILEYILQY